MERGVSFTSAPQPGSLKRRFLSTSIILCLFISVLPSAIADDDWSTATVLTDGSSSSEAVDSDGDAEDWWTIVLVTGDRMQVDVSSSTRDYGVDLIGFFGIP